MKKILVPIDFSQNTDNSVRAACDIAKQLDCEIILFHSYFEMLIMQSLDLATMDALPLVEPNAATRLYDQSERNMQKLAKNVRKMYPDITVHFMVSPVELKEKILDICENEDVLMIVMSATGKGKKDSFTGSAASSLFDSTPVPIIAIPEGYHYVHDALFKNILYATDFSDVAQNEIQFIAAYFLGNINKLYCCHLSFREKDIVSAKEQMQMLKSTFPKEEASGKMVFKVIETNDIEDALEALTEDQDIGLISFHEHDRTIFYRFFRRSVVKKNIYRFNIPLLVFRRFQGNGKA